MFTHLSSKHILWVTGGLALVVLCALALVRAEERVAMQPSATQSSSGGSSPGTLAVDANTAGEAGGRSNAMRGSASNNAQGDTQSGSSLSFIASIASNISEAFSAVGDAVVGVFVPASSSDVNSNSTSSGDAGVAANASEPKEVNFSPAVGLISNLGGTIKSVGEGSFVLSTVIPNEGVKITTIIVDSSTSVSRLVAKDETLLANERAAAEANGAPPPEPFTLQIISLADLSEGMLVTVELAEGTDGTAAVMHAKSVGVLPI